jgi:TrmH family RNA methyltransferase
VVLVSPRNPLNIGAAARAMSNFGFFHLRLVNPYGVAFREARSAVGAGTVIEAAEEHPSIAHAVADCALVVGTTSVGPRDLKLPIERLEQGAPQIRGASAPGRVALLFGSEKFGLTHHEMSHCDWLIRVPSRPEHGSMNLGQAVAVCLYELIRESSFPKDEPLPPTLARPHAARRASEEAIERVRARLMEALERSGYTNPVTASSTEDKIRRLVKRMDLSASDAVVWLGILRQITWRLSSPDDPERRSDCSILDAYDEDRG